jgi:hypothetical protein
MNPWVVAQIEKAVAPYVGKLSADDVAWMREQLAETLTHDEHASAVLRAAVPRVVDESGEVARGEGRTTDDVAREADAARAAQKKAR